MSRLRPTRSTLREALDTMTVERSGRPVADLIRMIARLGSTIAETACVLDCTVEEIKAFVGGEAALSHHQADLAHVYLLFLWWQHSWRSKFKGSDELDTIEQAHRPLAEYWDRMPKMCKRDWTRAWNEAKGNRNVET